MSRPNTWSPAGRPPVSRVPHFFFQSHTGAPPRERSALQRPLRSDTTLARRRSMSSALPVIPYIYIHHNHYLVSTHRIASAINKVVHRNTHFALLLTSESCTRTVTVPFSTDTLPILRTSPARSEPHSSFTYPVAVRSPIVTLYLRLILKATIAK
jgi:hypothetical protein